MSHQIQCVLPASFRPFTGGQRNVTVEADSTNEAIDQLVTKLPELKQHVIDQNGNLQPYINLFVDNQQVSDLKADSTALKDGSEILIISALAGG